MTPRGPGIGRTWRTMPDRLTAIVALWWLGVGTQERFHLGEPLASDREEPGMPATPRHVPYPGSSGRLGTGNREARHTP